MLRNCTWRDRTGAQHGQAARPQSYDDTRQVLSRHESEPRARRASVPPEPHQGARSLVRSLLGAITLLLSLAAAPAAAQLVASDNFASGGYSGGTGWSGSWTEFDDSGSGAGAGNLGVFSGQLFLRGDGNNTASYVFRSVNLSGHPVALLIFDINTNGADSNYEDEDEIEIYTRSGDSDSWTRIRQFNALDSVVAGFPRSHHVLEIPTSDISSTTQIRFGVQPGANILVGGSNASNFEVFFIDNVEIYGVPIRLDFETNELVGGTPLGNGWGQGTDNAQIFNATNQPYADDGITITGFEAGSPGNPVMVFDSNNLTGGDTDLGSPNPGFNYAGGQQCPGGQIGAVGSAGVIGGPGENCQPLGNILIISENGNTQFPNDSASGGIITISFHRPVLFTAGMFLDDIETDGSDVPEITLNRSVGGPLVTTFNGLDDFAGNGENGKFWATFNDFGSSSPIANVTSIEINLEGTSGGTGAFFISYPGIDLGDLPNSYGTLIASNGPRHVINPNNALRLGANVDSDADGQPTANANGDDAPTNTGASYFGFDDEDGVTLPASSEADGDGDDFAYTAAVSATNATNSPALLCGWMDFDDDGSFDNTANTGTTGADPGSGSASADGERSCVTIPANTNNGTFNVSWDIPPSARDNIGQINFRFRVTSDSSFLSGPTPLGLASNGEVEDYVRSVSSLPVSLGSFDSRLLGNLLRVRWSTVSETFNVGFAVWARVKGEWRMLTEDPILSAAADAVTPQRYSTRIWLRDLSPRDIEGLALSSIETTGGQEFYGAFDVGRSYGEEALPAPIPWTQIRLDHSERMQAQGFSWTGRDWRREGGIAAALTGESPDRIAEFRVVEPGMQRVTYEDLANAGVDLRGVPAGEIAVTLKGQGVVRHVAAGRSGLFGPGDAIEFWGVLPDYPDALYVEHYTYRIGRSAARAYAAGDVDRRVAGGVNVALEPVVVNDDVGYDFVNPLPDPWYAKQLRYPWGPVAHATPIVVGDGIVGDRPGRVVVHLSGQTDIPGADPDHHVIVNVNGQDVAEIRFDGQVARVVEADIPAGVLVAGANTVTVSLPGGTDAPFDLVLVDRVEVWYPRVLDAEEGRVLVRDDVSGEGILAGGFDSDDLVGYAHDASGNLARLVVSTRPEGQDDATAARILELQEILSSRRSNWRERLRARRELRSLTEGGSTGPYQGAVATLAPNPRVEGVEYWISTPSALHRPEPLGSLSPVDVVPGDAAEFLVIAHPAFLPLDDEESHPLNTYLEHRRAQGWTVQVVSIDDIQQAYGGGMALPGALTRFLEDAESSFDFEHVLLVGSDTYDYHDRLGQGSLSFIPTLYGRAGVIAHSPSDVLLADLDDDGDGDKSIGRWPVRTLSDLSVMVQKTLDWEDPVDGPMYQRSSVWATDGADPNVASFEAQAERMIARLLTPLAGGASEPWPADSTERVFYDDITPDDGLSVAETARRRLFEAIEGGRTLTGFFGHGAPSAWTFKGLMTAKHVADLDNEGQPTMVTTLTCYTSYFVSPFSDTLANRLMNGFRTDGAGERIPGVANGAIAVHGASTLSSYADNETVAAGALQRQLNDGQPIGAAIRDALNDAASAGASDVSRNWILLGDPTLGIGNRP